MNIEKFLVPENAKLKLAEHATDFTGDYIEKKQAEKDLEKNVERLAKLQDVLWAENKHALLIIFQAMDAAGKDGAIKHVMSGLNPQGVHVSSFKQPSAEELDHDYLWRSMKQLPERGRIGIFNRSYYEDVLIVRVHPQILQGKQLPEKIKSDKNIWQKRFAQIRNFENYLAENGYSHNEIFSSRFQRRTKKTLSRADQHAGKKLEIFGGRRERKKILGRIYEGLPGRD